MAAAGSDSAAALPAGREVARDRDELAVDPMQRFVSASLTREEAERVRKEAEEKIRAETEAKIRADELAKEFRAAAEKEVAQCRAKLDNAAFVGIDHSRDHPDAPPVAAREFSRTERLMIRVAAYAPGGADLTWRGAHDRYRLARERRPARQPRQIPAAADVGEQADARLGHRVARVLGRDPDLAG